LNASGDGGTDSAVMLSPPATGLMSLVSSACRNGERAGVLNNAAA
jgi:hypothetical protein